MDNNKNSRYFFSVDKQEVDTDYEAAVIDCYNYSIERQDKNGKRDGRHSKFGARLASLILSGMIVSGIAGGAAGYYIAALNKPETQAYEQQIDEYNIGANQGINSVITPVVSNTNGVLTIEEVYEKCNPAVVAISTELRSSNVFGQYSQRASAGSGFIISANGYVVTNYHVIDGASLITVMLSDGNEYDALVVGGDRATDIAVLKIEVDGLPFLTFGDSDSMVVGNQVVAIGNPLGELANTLTVGYVSAKERTINIDGDPMIMLQTDASISPGNSGGPLFNMYGAVIGIVSAKSSGNGVEGIGFAIPSNTAHEIINDLIDNGYVTGRPYLGISLTEIDSSMSRYYNLPVGVYINSVTLGSCSEKAGLKKGDVIVAFGGEEIATFAQLKAEKLRYKAGDTVNVTILRDSVEMVIAVTLDEEVPEALSVAENIQSNNNRRNIAEGA